MPCKPTNCANYPFSSCQIKDNRQHIPSCGWDCGPREEGRRGNTHTVRGQYSVDAERFGKTVVNASVVTLEIIWQVFHRIIWHGG